MIRYYLLTMFALPVLELFDRWKAKHTDRLNLDGAFTLGRRFAWHEYEGQWDGHGWCYVSVFHLDVPFVRHWRVTPQMNIDGLVEGFHRLMLVHVKVRGAQTTNRWMREWIPLPSCTPVRRML